MSRSTSRLLVIAAILGAMLIGDSFAAKSADPGWSPVVIATGAYRQQLQATPIEQRPYRPLHFYGNTVRRRHYRSTPTQRPSNQVTSVNRARR